MHLIHEGKNQFVASLNGEQLKLYVGVNSVYVHRWTYTGWQHFIELPPLPKPQAKQKAVEILVKLTSNLPFENHHGRNGQYRPQEAPYLSSDKEE